MRATCLAMGMVVVVMVWWSWWCSDERPSQAVAGALWVSLNLVLLQQQQQAEMALGRVNICCASKITSMLHFLPFASASCACLLRATGGGPGRPAALGLRALIGTTW